MPKRLAALCALCLLLCCSLNALATDGGSEEGFVEPTRDPNAPEYDWDYPDELVQEQIVAHSFILVESSSNEPLMWRDPDVRMFPASTTKIMTAYIALQIFDDLSEIITVSETAVDIPEDSSRVPFKAGEQVTLRDALYGLLLKSGNEAANAIAEHISGDIPSFVARMNQTAEMLGCTNTYFVNPHGYHDELHQTTARDLAVIMRAALQNETFREIISTLSYTLSATSMNPARVIENSNLHLHRENEDRYYEYSIGGKTGFTSQAGYVLVEAAEKDGVELIAVIMYSNKYARWPDTSRLFQYGFTFYKSVTAQEIYAANPTSVQVSGFAMDDSELGSLRLDIKAVDPSRTVRFIDKTEEIDRLIENYAGYTNITYESNLQAPIEQGEIIGIMTFYPPNEEPAQYQLLASRSIEARENIPPTLEEIEQRVLDDPSPFPPFSWDWVLPPALGMGALILLTRGAFKLLLRRRRGKKKLPTPKRRTYT